MVTKWLAGLACLAFLVSPASAGVAYWGGWDKLFTMPLETAGECRLVFSDGQNLLVLDVTNNEGLVEIRERARFKLPELYKHKGPLPVNPPTPPPPEPDDATPDVSEDPC